MKKLFISFLVLGAISLLACQSTNMEETAQLLIGRWEIEQATRNGSPTESLANLYFEFTTDGTLMTNMNMTGEAEQGTYELKNNQVLQRNTQLSADYNIEEITDANLILSTELNGTSFRFDLKKVDTDSMESPQQSDLQ